VLKYQHQITLLLNGEFITGIGRPTKVRKIPQQTIAIPAQTLMSLPMSLLRSLAPKKAPRAQVQLP
jgi:hypothetical protein